MTGFTLRYFHRICAAIVTATTVVGCSSDTMTSPTPPATNPPQPAPAPPAPAPTPAGVTTDEALFRLVTQSQPFSAYTLFPRLDAGADAILPAAGAHVPFVRVSLNATAAAALQNGRLPSGATFPDGSVIFKEVLTSGRSVTVYAVMYKDRSNASAGNGWLWAEYRPDGRADYPIRERGGACTGCHSLGDGSRNDSVRIFERQR